MRKLIICVAFSPDVVEGIEQFRGRGQKSLAAVSLNTAIRNYLHEFETVEELPHTKTEKPLTALSF